MKTLKEWKLEEAARRGVSYRAICSALSRGRIPYPRVVRLNARLVLVLEPEPTKALLLFFGSVLAEYRRQPPRSGGKA